MRAKLEKRNLQRRDLTFRVFVSSTFNDLRAERNALQEYVFPRLRELDQTHGAQVWGSAFTRFGTG